MDKAFFITIAIVGITSTAISFIPSEKMHKSIKILLFILILLCLVFQSFYGWKEKTSADKKDFRDALYQDESLRRQFSISEDIKRLRDKENKGLLTDNEYSLYIARYLESIDNTLKFKDGRNIREWITLYYSEVDKIPSFYSLEDWKEAENLIYANMLNEINGQFASRGTFNSGMRPKLLEQFKAERERLLKEKGNIK